mgnify:CR=1 FL=1
MLQTMMVQRTGGKKLFMSKTHREKRGFGVSGVTTLNWDSTV